MDIGRFIDEYMVSKDPKAKEKIVKSHVVTTYLDYAKKIEESKKIVKYSCYDADGNFVINSPIRFMLFMMSVIRNYTDLEFSTENPIGQFDLIMKYDIGNVFISNFAEDYKSFETVLKMVFDDEYENQRSMVSFIEHKMDAVLAAVSAMDIPEQKPEGGNE